MIIDVATGRILKSGSAPDDAIALMTAPGEGSIVGIDGVSDESYYVGPAGITPYPPRPGPWAAFDFTTETWFDPRTQADLDEELRAVRSTMVVSRFQAKAALLSAGLLAPAEALVAGSDALTQLAWAEAIEYRRDSPAIAALAGALGLTETDLDDLFVAAAGITA